MRLPILPATVMAAESSHSVGPFSQRVAAISFIVVRNIIMSLAPLQLYSDENLKLANVSSLTDYLSLPSRSSLFLYLWDHLMSGIALPKLPHVEFIGGITAGPARDLEDDLKKWVDAAVDGFVVCTFGSLVTLKESMIEKLFHLFNELKPLPVIFKISHSNIPDKLISHIPQNVFMMDWLPQNDLLGHRNARLFITHAGTNGYGEALYHGVPMVTFPLMIAQKIMASNIETLGFGKEGSLFAMNGTDIVAITKGVLNSVWPKLQK